MPNFFHDLELSFIMAQVFGLLTALVSIYTVQLKDMKPILLLNVLCNVLSVVTFYFAGGMSGAWVCLIAIIQSLWIYDYTRQGRSFPVWLNYIFIALYSGAILFTMKYAYDLLPGLAAIMYALGAVQKDSGKYRLFILVNSLSWIVFDLFTGAYTMIITHGLILVSILVAMIRLDRKRTAVDERELNG